MLRAILALYGAHMGENVLPDTGDAVDFFPFYDEFINATVRNTRRIDYALDDVPAAIRTAAIALLRRQVAGYCSRLEGGKILWGIKGPRSMYMLPYWLDVLPDMTFLHLIRDGRDMAVSSNQAQVHRHYAALFGEPAGPDTAVAAARLWNKANLEAAAWCRTHLPGRHLVVKYEQLSASPAHTIAQVFDFLQWSYSPQQPAALAAVVIPSPTIGRWSALADERRGVIVAACSEALHHFGYVT